MENSKTRLRVVCKNKILLMKFILIIVISLSACGYKEVSLGQVEEMKLWKENANLTDTMSADELYQEALNEDTMVIYSVSSRMFEVKESFENEYPGLTVEIKDVRGNDLVDMLLKNYEREEYGCDLVVCSDSDGSLKKELLEPGIVYSYIPWDIESHIKEGHA